jgi:acyl-CoA thioesterase
MSNKTDLQAWAAQQGKLDRLPNAMGIALLSLEPGVAKVTMTVGADSVNAHGNCHGGAIFTLADTAFFYLCNSHERHAVAAGCDINFIRPGMLGDVLTATCMEQHVGKRSGLYHVDVHNQHGKLIAVMSARAAVVRPPPAGRV